MVTTSSVLEHSCVIDIPELGPSAPDAPLSSEATTPRHCTSSASLTIDLEPIVEVTTEPGNRSNSTAFSLLSRIKLLFQSQTSIDAHRSEQSDSRTSSIASPGSSFTKCKTPVATRKDVVVTIEGDDDDETVYTSEESWEDDDAISIKIGAKEDEKLAELGKMAVIHMDDGKCRSVTIMHKYVKNVFNKHYQRVTCASYRYLFGLF